MIDKSLHFGQSQYFFHDLVDTDPTYDYVLYVDVDGPVLIGRYTKAGTSARYTLQVGTYSTILANVGTFTYNVVSSLVDPRVSD